jgi:hypothetical protein
VGELALGHGPEAHREEDVVGYCLSKRQLVDVVLAALFVPA